MTTREGAGDTDGVVEFALDVLELEPGMSVLVLGDGRVSDAIAVQVGSRGRVQVAATPADTPTSEFDRICAVSVPDFRSGAPAPVAALASRLRVDGQLWVIDEAPPGESTGPRSMSVSATLARCGFALVDMLERGPLVAIRVAAR